MTHPDFLQSHKYSDACIRNMKFIFESYSGTGTQEIVRALTCDPPELEIDDYLKKIIFTCTICGNCQEICNAVKDLEPANAMMALRNYVVKKEGPHKGKKFWGCWNFPYCRGMREYVPEGGG